MHLTAGPERSQPLRVAAQRGDGADGQAALERAVGGAHFEAFDGADEQRAAPRFEGRHGRAHRERTELIERGELEALQLLPAGLGDAHPRTVTNEARGAGRAGQPLRDEQRTFARQQVHVGEAAWHVAEHEHPPVELVDGLDGAGGQNGGGGGARERAQLCRRRGGDRPHATRRGAVGETGERQYVTFGLRGQPEDTAVTSDRRACRFERHAVIDVGNASARVGRECRAEGETAERPWPVRNAVEARGVGRVADVFDANEEFRLSGLTLEIFDVRDDFVRRVHALARRVSDRSRDLRCREGRTRFGGDGPELARHTAQRQPQHAHPRGRGD